MTWDGTPRRVDDSPDSLSVRVALLEEYRKDTVKHMEETKTSLESVHKRLSNIQDNFASALDRGLDAIMDKMDSDKKDMKPTLDKVIDNTSCIAWIQKWMGALTAWDIAISTWILSHVSGKH